MLDHERYNVKVGQRYVPADGSVNVLSVINVETYADCGDVIVYDHFQRVERRIDCFKLVLVRYKLSVDFN
jgi:hypothetical protein